MGRMSLNAGAKNKCSMINRCKSLREQSHLSCFDFGYSPSLLRSSWGNVRRDWLESPMFLDISDNR